MWAIDLHSNYSPPTQFSVSTPPAGAIDPRQIGVRPEGAYWGAGLEKIDMRSGNLNVTVPLFRAEGRGGWGVTFALSYNSQNWRNEPNGTWKQGADIGYGFGWKLQAGSLTPSYTGVWNLHHYTFTDSTGAEYRLDQTSGSVWRSKQGIYIEYEPATRRLYFPDGSFWTMDAESSGAEQDAGTLYPTRMQDTNGNFITIAYKTGLSAPFGNSSGRIESVRDVRAPGTSAGTFVFTYNTDPIPHLIEVGDQIAARINYKIGYWVNANLVAPTPPHTSHGQAHLLLTLTNSASEMHTFQYFAYGFGNAGELSRIDFPHGGQIRYWYNTYTYKGSRQFREVAYRYLLKSTGGSEQTYTLERDPGDLTFDRTVHALAGVHDPTGVVKQWNFFWDTNDWRIGLPQAYGVRPDAWTGPTQQHDYTWTTDSAGNPYIGTVDTWTNGMLVRREQQLDEWGNTLVSKLYPVNNTTTPSRTYTNTYLTGSQYTSRRIRNRLVSSVLTGGPSAITLVTNSYDQGLEMCPGCPWSFKQQDDINYGMGMPYRGNVSQSVTPGATRRYFYDYSGNVHRADDGLGHSVSVTRSSTYEYTVPQAITANGLSTSFTWDAYLSPTSQTGPNSDDIILEYDAYGRPKKTRTVEDAEWTITYSGATTTRTKTLGSSGLGRWTRTTVDGLGRTIKVESGDTAGTKTIADTEYDACACSPMGKVKRVSQPYAPGTPANQIWWTVYEYDELGRTKSVSHKNGDGTQSTGTTTYAYYQNLVMVTDPKGRWKKFTIDAFGNLVQVEEPNPAGGSFSTHYTYDVLNHLTQVSMPRPTGTQTRTFVYNTQQRLQSATNPENGTVTYTYNADGTMATKTDAKQILTNYTYTPEQRLQSECKSQPSPGECKSYTYGGPSGSYAAGRVRTAQYTIPDRMVTETFGYTPAGRLASKVVAIDGMAAKTATQTYNEDGQLNSITYPDGTMYTYQFDSMGRPWKMTQVDAAGTVWVKDVLYNVAGRMTEMWERQVEDAVSGQPFARTVWQYNVRQQLTRITTTPVFSQPGAQDIEYVYSATQNDGKIERMKNWISGEEVNYQYDSLERLIAASTTGPEWGLSFSYDGFGNRLSQTRTKGQAPEALLTFDALKNRINLAGYGYDANGNVTQTPGVATPMVYDGWNRLTGVGSYVTPEGETLPAEQYAYSPDNKRVYYRRLGTETFYFWMGGRQLNGPGGNVLYFAGRRLKVMGKDRLGSDVSGTKYFPYGEEPTTTAQDRWKFATYWRDATGLDYADQRYYSSATGRFITPDPYVASASTTDPQSWNRYAYVVGDPVNFNDPSGQVYCWVDSFVWSTDGDYVAVNCRSNDGTAIASGVRYNLTIGPRANHDAFNKVTGSVLAEAARDFKEADPNDWDLVPSALKRALRALSENPECLELFGNAETRAGRWDPRTVLNSMFGDERNNDYGTVDFEFTGYGAAETRPAGFIFPNIFNRNLIQGSRANISIHRNWWNGSGVEENAATILHELGHVYNFSRGSGGFRLSNLSERNDPAGFDKLIKEKCIF